VKLRYKRLRVSDLKTAMWDVLENEKYRLAAQRIRDTFIQAGSNEKATELLETFAKKTYEQTTTLS
jgi:UDP:flavonoid glycosyltransferase YjiC (YdhE family)